MGVRAGTAPAPKPAAAGFAALVALVVSAGAVLLAARADGVSYWGTSMTLAVGLRVSVLVTSALGWWILRRADRSSVAGCW